MNTDRPINRILQAIENVTGQAGKRIGQGWQARCPAHQDKRPSLSIAEGDDGRVLIRCHAGCTADAIAAALGLRLCDLMPDRGDDRPPHNTTRPRPGPRRATMPNGKVFTTGNEAVSALERQYGARSALWTYHDANGEPVGVVVRWDRADGGKDIRPVSKRGTGWVIGAMPTPRPQYRLGELKDARRIFIPEGEKCVEALRSIGLIATTSAGGSQTADKTSWAPLAGKDCLIVPDKDKAGAKYADDVLELLAKLAPMPSMKIVELPGLPDGGDVVDFIAARRAEGRCDAEIRAEIESLADAAEKIDVGSSEPTVLSWRPFPVDVLPAPCREFLIENARAMGCDPAYLALAMLPTMASAIGNSRLVLLKRGWTEPTTIWCAIVGKSGTIKSPAIDAALRPIRALEERKMAEYRAALARHESRIAEWEGAKKKDRGPKPLPPTCVRLAVDDITIEALGLRLQENPRGLLLATDELATWFASFKRYRGREVGSDVPRWLAIHGARVLRVDRKSNGAPLIYVPRANVSIIGGIQPGKLATILTPDYFETGLVARQLFAWPPALPKRWTDAEPPAYLDDLLANVFEQLYSLDLPLDSNGVPKPKVIGLSAEAKRLWVEFFNTHNTEAADLDDDESAAWSKLEAYAARLALVLHLIEWAANERPEAGPVTARAMERAIILTRWFGHETKRVYAMLTESEDARKHRRLVEWIERRGGSVTVRDLTHGLREYRNRPEAARADLDALVDVARGRWEVQPPTAKGGQPTARFVLVSIVTVTRTPPEVVENKGNGDGDTGDGGTDASDGDRPVNLALDDRDRAAISRSREQGP